MERLLASRETVLPVSTRDSDAPAPRWLERIRDGDADAFRALFRAFYPGLCGFANRYVGSPEVAEELAQEVFLAVWERRLTLDPRGSIEGFLYQSVRNRALNHIKHRSVRSQCRDAITRLHEPPPTPEDDLRYTEILEAVQEAINELPPGARRIFLLSREAGLSHAEIAALLDISVKTVENQMGRALKSLRSTLAPVLS